MSRNIVETLIGAVVITVAVGFFAFAYDTADLKKVSGYEINANFENIGGISAGSDVRLGGVKIGTITSVSLDPETYLARIDMSISENYELPADSSASIASDGLLGGKFVAVTPGGDENIMKPGDRISYTQSSVSLEELLGKLVFSAGGVDKKEEE